MQVFSRFRSFKLQTKLQLSFILVGLLSVSTTGWQAFENARNALETLSFERLTSIRETKKRQIELYFQQIANHNLTLAEDRFVTDAVAQFSGAFAGTDRKNSTGDRTSVSPSMRYDRIHGMFHPIFQNYIRRFGYDDILLVERQTGNIVYSAAGRPDFGTSLLAGPYSGTSCAAVFREALAGTPERSTSFTDFVPYPPAGDMPASFIASPISSGGRSIGVLIFRLSNTAMNQVMTSGNHWRDEGLGETGETYIVGSDYTMRTDSRFFIQEPDAYFKRLIRIGADPGTVDRIKARGSSILLQQVRTTATIDALHGTTDTKIINDYRGIPVLSSYTPLNIPGVHWVMLAEIDASEAFNSVYVLRERLMLIGIAILFLAAVASVLITRTIAHPILSLTKATEKFGKGDLSYRAETGAGVSNDEIGLLATTFNRMAESTMQKTLQLTEEIAERRRAEEQVRQSQERLRNLSVHLQTVREEERKGIAREIHDELGQALTTLKLNLILLNDDLATRHPQGLPKIESMLQLIDTTIRSVKRMITALRPRLLDDLGLTAAIEWLTDDFEERTGIICTLELIPEDILTDPERSTAIFRIVQEALTNVSRHSHATTVRVRLVESESSLELTIADNGIGVTEQQVNDPRSFGFIGIRERANYWGGRVEIRGVPASYPAHDAMDCGTTIKVHLPIEKGNAQ